MSAQELQTCEWIEKVQLSLLVISKNTKKLKKSFLFIKKYLLLGLARFSCDHIFEFWPVWFSHNPNGNQGHIGLLKNNFWEFGIILTYHKLAIFTTSVDITRVKFTNTFMRQENLESDERALVGYLSSPIHSCLWCFRNLHCTWESTNIIYVGLLTNA